MFSKQDVEACFAAWKIVSANTYQKVDAYVLTNMNMWLKRMSVIYVLLQKGKYIVYRAYLPYMRKSGLEGD